MIGDDTHDALILYIPKKTQVYKTVKPRFVYSYIRTTYILGILKVRYIDIMHVPMVSNVNV